MVVWHLQSYPWFIDCSFIFTPEKEEDEKDERKFLGEPISSPKLLGLMQDSLDAPQSAVHVGTLRKGNSKKLSKLDPVPVTQPSIVAHTPPPSYVESLIPICLPNLNKIRNLSTLAQQDPCKSMARAIPQLLLPTCML